MSANVDPYSPYVGLMTVQRLHRAWSDVKEHRFNVSCLLGHGYGIKQNDN